MSQLPKPKADMELVQGARKRMGEGFRKNQPDRRLTTAVYTSFVENPLELQKLCHYKGGSCHSCT